MIAIAGGITEGGADIAILTGNRNGKPFRKEIDVAGMFLANDFKDDVVVSGGDVVYVDKMPRYYIYGEAQRPGYFRVERNMTVRQALAVGGGVTGRGSDRLLLLYRPDVNGRIQTISPNLGDRILPNDVLYVVENMFYVYGEAQRPGTYRIERDMTVRQALALAGGPTPRGTERRLRIFRRQEDGKIGVVTPELDDLVRPDDVLYVNESFF